MHTPLLPVWTQVDAPVLIQCILEWHMENKTPLQLMVDFRTDPLPAHIVGMDENQLLVLCSGLPNLGNAPRPMYTLSGKSSDGDILAVGQVLRVAGSGDILTLQHPLSLSVSQQYSGQHLLAAPRGRVTKGV